MTTFYTLTFNTGGGNNGGHQLYPGDIIWESSHTLSALVIAVNTTSGTWAGGNAAGTLTMQVIYGSWTASQYFDASCAGANTAYIVSLAVSSIPPQLPGLISTPTVSHANYTRFLTSIQVKRSLTDKMYSATLGFDQNTVAGQISNIYWNQIMAWIPDYTGTYNLVFLGIAPSSTSDYKAAGGDETLTAYSYGWYLSKQFLDPNLVNMPWQTGNQMAPDTFVHGCIDYALALAGGVWSPTGSWLPYMTGLSSYGVESITGWGAGLTAVPFAFTTKTTKQAAIDTLCGYCSALSYDHWDLINLTSVHVWNPIYRFINYANIDASGVGGGGLNLPAAVNVTSGATTTGSPADGNGYLISDVKLLQQGENASNFFQVRGQYPSGAWFQQQTWNAGVYDLTFNPSGTIIKVQVLRGEQEHQQPDRCL